MGLKPAISPLLTVVMICHNDESHLPRAFDALKKGIVGKHDELVRVLFVDDCSNDDSLGIATNLVDGIGEAIKTPHNMNVGGARNHGIDYLRSLPKEKQPIYIWFHDSDDYITDDGLDRVVSTLKANEGVDILSIPFGVRKKKAGGEIKIRNMPVVAKNIYEAPNMPVGVWCKVFKMEKFVPNAPYQMCEHVAWHYELYDQMDSWAKVEGDSPCYIWDRTSINAITNTIEFCNKNPMTIEYSAFSNILVQKGLKDKWISDNLRNLANMYDLRHKLKKPWVKGCWSICFKSEYASIMTGHHVH